MPGFIVIRGGPIEIQREAAVALMQAGYRVAQLTPEETNLVADAIDLVLFCGTQEAGKYLRGDTFPLSSSPDPDSSVWTNDGWLTPQVYPKTAAGWVKVVEDGLAEAEARLDSNWK